MEKDFFDYLNIIGSLTISLITLLFAYFIYRKVSFKKTVLDKQFEAVTQLVHVLQDITLYVTRTKDSENNTSSCLFFNFSSIFQQQTEDMWFQDFKEILNRKVCFTSRVILNPPFIKFSKYPFIPRKIARAIDDFIIFFPNEIYDVKFDKYITVDLIYQSTNQTEEFIRLHKDTLRYSVYEFNDFGSFYNTCLKLDFEIKDWLKKYGVKDLNIG